MTGASSITNVTAVAYGDMPLFLFHLLEFMDVDYEIDVDELNERWAHPRNIDDWTQFILKQTDDPIELITEAPASGIWRMAGRPRDLVRPSRNRLAHRLGERRGVLPADRGAGSATATPAPTSGILVTRGRFLDDEHELTDRARRWIDGDQGAVRERAARARGARRSEPEPFGFKMLWARSAR